MSLIASEFCSFSDRLHCGTSDIACVQNKSVTKHFNKRDEIQAVCSTPTIAECKEKIKMPN